jgi:predicted dehydrogenase
VYGEKAYAHAYGGNQVRQRQAGEKAESLLTPEALPGDEADAISYLKAVVRDGKQPGGLPGLENNLIATEILVAARASAAKAR